MRDARKVRKAVHARHIRRGTAFSMLRDDEHRFGAGFALAIVQVRRNIARMRNNPSPAERRRARHPEQGR
ncbi:MAG: hypothetical protein WDN24_11100 [Sphingomonas sp.]